jgi:hypothetical protein
MPATIAIDLAHWLRGVRNLSQNFTLMSSYRKLDDVVTITADIRDDVYAYRARKKQYDSIAKQEPPASDSSDAYKHLRKNAPANIPLPRTQKWFDGLPPPVRPVALMRHFARVANLIAAAWDDLDHFEGYMESLLTDKRGRRKGFPPEVIAELTSLDVYRHAQELQLRIGRFA